MSRPKPNFTLEQLLEELKMIASSEGFTTEDLAKQTGHTVSWARDIIRAGISQGKIKYAGRRTDFTIDRRLYHHPVYIFVDAKQDGGKEKE